MLPFVLLPGMDGTGALFDRFVRELPSNARPSIVSYPDDPSAGYDELTDHVAARLRSVGPSVLVAESFSGPIAIRVARRHPDLAQHVVLAASFLRNPMPRGMRSLLRCVPRTTFRVPLPRPALRFALCGRGAPARLVADVSAAIRSVSPDTLAARCRAIARVDVTADARQLQTPVLSLLAGQDRLLGRRGAQQIRLAIPHAMAHGIDGPHLLLQTRAADAATAVMRATAADATMASQPSFGGTPRPADPEGSR
ncbi:MAG: alpha/beta fold hydrolase [Phycisphaerales bacterium]